MCTDVLLLLVPCVRCLLLLAIPHPPSKAPGQDASLRQLLASLQTHLGQLTSIVGTPTAAAGAADASQGAAGSTAEPQEPAFGGGGDGSIVSASAGAKSGNACSARPTPAAAAAGASEAAGVEQQREQQEQLARLTVACEELNEAVMQVEVQLQQVRCWVGIAWGVGFTFYP